eukprot:CAMPEP_0198273460 /NCGR_PEP_ID=MMETSP1447-20131203/56974_1 /TAXON_ID=420782 /ORGANISM="Chaetoceros dichaeta, Strain CCMP1751" /LENGTH=39 /DNA_ID= /DNA_START= /DNA_END= /DNA_ORIENTATION=
MSQPSEIDSDLEMEGIDQEGDDEEEQMPTETPPNPTTTP